MKRIFDKNIEIGLEFLLVLFYTFGILINDIFSFLLRTNLNIFSYIASFLIISAITFFLIKNKVIRVVKINYSKFDIVFLFLISFIVLSRIAIPDSSFDTLNYHIISQEQPFSDNISDNFFPGTWINTFTIPLADRMHYLFRLILGYNFGVLANVLVLIVVYFQIKRLLLYFQVSSKLIVIIASLCLFSDQIFFILCSYYVDIIPIPFFLEIIIICVKSISDKKKNSKKAVYHYLVAFISGLLIAIKLSNLVFLIPLILMYILINIKQLSIVKILISALIVCMPPSVYLAHNYIETKNPIFPFGNSIFRSELEEVHYESEIPQKQSGDNNYAIFGPRGKKEVLLWPVLISFMPSRTGEIANYYGKLGVGYISSIILLVILVFKFHKDKSNQLVRRLIFLNSLFLICTMLWSVGMYGYIRYALILEVLSPIIIYFFIIQLLSKRNLILDVLTCLILSIVIIQSSLSISEAIRTNQEISYRNSFLMDPESYYKNLFPNNLPDTKELTKKIDCFGIFEFNSAYASLLNSEIPIININRGDASQYAYNIRSELLSQCKNLYTVSTGGNLEKTKNKLNQYRYHISGEIISLKTNFLNNIYDLLIIPIARR